MSFRKILLLSTASVCLLYGMEAKAATPEPISAGDAMTFYGDIMSLDVLESWGSASKGDVFRVYDEDAYYIYDGNVWKKLSSGDTYYINNGTDWENLSANFVQADEVYTKTQTDNTFATKNAITDMLTKTEAGNVYATKSSLNSYVTLSELSDYMESLSLPEEAETPTRDAMKAYNTDEYHGKYELSTVSTGEIGEKSININDTTYYFMPNEKTGSLTKTLNELIASGVGVTTTGASESDYVFKVGDTYYKFDTSSISASKISIVEGTSSDYTYSKVLPNGTIKYYKVSGTTGSSAQNTNVTSDITGKFYSGKSSTASDTGGALTIKNETTINKIEADFKGNSSKNGGAIYNVDGTITNIIGDFSDNTATGYGGTGIQQKRNNYEHKRRF